jgi:UMF1 family MFS transporter
MKEASKIKMAIWVIFDAGVATFANLVTSFLFPQYVKNFLGGTEFHIGLTVSLALFLVAIVTPVLGTYSDVTGRKVSIMRFLSGFVVLGILGASIPNLWAALGLYLMASFFAHNNLALFGSMLPSIAPGRVGKVAGFGVAAGSVGVAIGIGIFSLVSSFGYGGGELPGLFSTQNVQVLFWIAAGLYIVWSLPLLVTMRDKVKARLSFGKALKLTFREIEETLKRLGKYGNLGKFYIGEFFYNNGIISLGVFLVLYSQVQLKLPVFNFALMYLAFLAVGMISALISGRLVDQVGPRKVQIWALIFWASVIGAFILFPNVYVFFGMGLLGGFATGMLVAADRPMLVALAPPEHIGQFFGFDEIVGRTSGVVGPFIFGLLVTLYGYNVALFLIMVFILLALFFISEIRGKFGKIEL